MVSLTVAPLLLCLFTVVYAQQNGKSLTDALNGQSNASEFATLLNTYGDLYANLSFQQDITLLVPNNDAFAQIPYMQLLNSAFEANQSDVVRAVLEYHVLPGLHPANSFNGTFSFVPTWLQNSSYTNVTGGAVVAGVQQAGNLDVFVTGLGSRSTLITGDIPFRGGLIHLIDSFLIPPQSFITTAPNFNLTAFAGATTNASLNPYISSASDITIFAPNNGAFQALGSTFSTLSSTDLASLLSYHIVNSSHLVGYSSSLPNATVLTTRQGANLTITFASNSLFVNSARVLQQDILIANGVLHVIDNVLDPNATAAQPNPELRTQVPVLQGSSLGGNVVPYATDYISTTSTIGSESSAPSSSFGVSDVGRGGSAVTSSAGSASSSTSAGGAGPTTTKKSEAGGEVGGTMGAVIGALGMVLGML